jgi:hypothetical protein
MIDDGRYEAIEVTVQSCDRLGAGNGVGQGGEFP